MNDVKLNSPIGSSNDTSSSSSSTVSTEEPNIDVKIPLQCLVRDGKLILHNSSKVNDHIHTNTRKH